MLSESTPNRSKQKLVLPLPGGSRKWGIETVDVLVPRPLRTADWDYLTLVLTAMKPALVEPPIEGAGDDYTI